MIDRFAVRRTEKGFGVWDAAVNGWHSKTDLDEPAATALADRMNAQEPGTQDALAADNNDTSAAGDRPEEHGSGGPVTRAKAPATGTLRRVRPPRPVLILIDGRWWPGRLDMWVREADGWYGRATLDRTGAMSWYPAISLRDSRQ